MSAPLGPRAPRFDRDRVERWERELAAEHEPDPYIGWDDLPEELDDQEDLDDDGEDRRFFSPSLGRFLSAGELEAVRRRRRR